MHSIKYVRSGTPLRTSILLFLKINIHRKVFANRCTFNACNAFNRQINISYRQCNSSAYWEHLYVNIL